MSNTSSAREEKLKRIIELEKVLNEIQDIDVLLERILTEARNIVHADAGSIYVYEHGMLGIRYGQNETQQKKLAPGQKLPYNFFTFPVNEKSMCGYAVLTGSILNVPDVYNLVDRPFVFNKQPDTLTGYRTKAVLTVPLKTATNKVLGVLQIINPQTEDNQLTEFDDASVLYIEHFATSATQALERAHLTRAMILRMVQMAEFRDPKETGAHVNRVSNYAVEIYDHWAFKHNVAVAESEKYRDALKIAAMLHDVGKVAISDVILRKPSRLTDEEYKIIQNHTLIGSRLFDDIQSPLDAMSRDVALRHHERWDGMGYPGKIDINSGEPLEINPDTGKPAGLSGEEIPLAARIVSLADVFDALSSKRVYKESWSEVEVLNEIQSQAGKQFDPELVMSFFEVLPNIRQIQMAWPD
ncbi:MAG: HD domain-containing protein [Spirochaetaceae bacterium]|nr:HD domain-containing protein [Spirochaetaceae bacterium]